LARLAGESDSGESQPGRESPLSASLTRTGTILGTPAYMAPEQLRGQAADARADVFSFCVSLYEALFGVRPFAGASVEELQHAIGEERIEAPRNADVPGWLQMVVRSGLRADPAARPGSMRLLLAALEQDPAALRRRRFFLGGAVVALAAAIGVPLFLA